MVSKIGDIECLLCDDLISFYDGETGIYQSHLELKHEVEEAKRDLVIAVCFLREQAQLCNKLRLRHHLLHKRRAWPRRLALAGPLARRGSPLFSCFNIEPCNDIFNY